MTDAKKLSPSSALLVCEGQPVFDSWAKNAAPAADQPSSSYTSRQRVSAAHSNDNERDQRLRLKSMQEFASALSAIAAK